MPLPTIPNVFRVRFSVTGSSLQRPATFHLDFFDIPGTQTEANLFTDLDASVTAAMWNLMSSNCGITKVEVIKLDGASASVINTIAAFPAKWTGSGGADAILQGAVVLSIKSALRGPAWRNRAYIGPVAEAKQLDGVLDTTTVATSQTAWNTFVAAMITAGWQLSVVSPSNDSSVSSTGVQLRPYLKTQRRRSRR